MVYGIRFVEYHCMMIDKFWFIGIIYSWNLRKAYVSWFRLVLIRIFTLELSNDSMIYYLDLFCMIKYLGYATSYMYRNGYSYTFLFFHIASSWSKCSSISCDKNQMHNYHTHAHQAVISHGSGLHLFIID